MAFPKEVLLVSPKKKVQKINDFLPKVGNERKSSIQKRKFIYFWESPTSILLVTNVLVLF